MQYELISSSTLKQKDWHIDGALMVMPFTQTAQAQRAAQLMARRAATNGLILGVHDDHSEGFVRLINHAFHHSHSHWFGYVAQDAFAGRNWLALAIQAIENANGGLLAFNDGKWHGQLAAFGIAKRSWAMKHYQGDFFFSGYQRHYADAELTLLALQEERLVYTAASVLIEVDWKKDMANVNAADRSLFLQRAAIQFDGKVIKPELIQRFC